MRNQYQNLSTENASWLHKHGALNWQWPGPRNCWQTNVKLGANSCPYSGPSKRTLHKRTAKERSAKGG